jgi:hypothetical protein
MLWPELPTMYQILHGSPERPWALSPWPSGIEGLNPGIRLCPAPEGVLLHLRENRSHLSERGRQAVAAIVFVWLACTILPALKGLWPVAAYSLAVMTALLVALGCHARSRPDPASQCVRSDGGAALAAGAAPHR